MHTKFCLSCLTLILTLVLIPISHGQDEQDNPEARAEWMNGYQKFEAAQKAENYKQYDDANALFSEALQIYSQVRAKYPNWNTFILDYRIKFCKKKLAELSTKTKIQKKEMNTADVVDLNADLQQKLSAAEAKAQEQDAQITRLGQALEKARQEAVRGSASAELAETLTWENRKLKTQVESLQRRQGELEEELKLNPKNEEAVNELRKQLEATRKQETQYREAREALAKERDELVENNKELSVQRAQLLVQLKDLDAAGGQGKLELQKQTKLAQALRDENERLAGQLEEKQAEIATKAKTIDKLQGTLADFKNKDKSAQQIQVLYTNSQKDNAQLREDLTAKDNTIAKQERQIATSKQNLDALQIANAKLRKELESAQQTQAKMRASVQEGQGVAKQLEVLRKERDEAKAKYDEQLELNRELSKVKTPGQPANQLDVKLQTALNEQAALITELKKELAEAKAQQTPQVDPKLQTTVNEQAALITELKKELTEAKAQQTPQVDPRLQATVNEQAAVIAQLKKELASGKPAAVTTPVVTIDADNKKLEAMQKQLEAKEQAVKELQASQAALAKQLATVKQAAATAPIQDPEQAKRVESQIAELRNLTEAQKELIAQRDAKQKELTTERNQLQKALDDANAQAKVEQAMLNRQLQKALEQLELSRETSKPAKAGAVQEKTPDTAMTSAEAEELDRQLREALDAENQNNNEAAIWLYEQVLKKDPTHYRSLVRLGNLYAHAGNFEVAERYLTQAFYQNPDDPDVLITLGSILVRMEKADLAISVLSRAVALFPEDANIQCNLGVACRELGWTEAAKVQFDRSFELDATNSNTAFNYAILYATMEPPNMEQARTWYERAKKLGANVDPAMERLFTESP